MITVIKQGNQLPKEGECDSCGCKFMYEREDCYWYGPFLSYILMCPNCGKKVLLGDVFDY